MSRIPFFAAIIFAGMIFVGVGAFAPSRAAASGASCSANPSTVVIGNTVQIECSGFDANAIVNAYVVESTGFAEIGRPSYAACLVGVNGAYDSASAKANETGTAHYNWYTPDGTGKCPVNNPYLGYAVQLGSYTVVVQELDGKGGIKYVGTAGVTITGNGKTYSGAHLETDGPGVSGGSLNVYGFGFAPNEYVNIWFTRPGNCSGLGDWYYTGMSAFNPEFWDGGGVSGKASVKTDNTGSFVAPYLLSDGRNAYPCIGTWHVTANAPGSKLGAEAEFTITGNSVSENAKVWTDETSVPSIGQSYTPYSEGVGVHVNGSGFPAGGIVNCWFTRPDGTVYQGFPENHFGQQAGIPVGSGGTFSSVTLTYSSEVGYQGEQPGTWAVTCGTPDGKYVGIAHFLVYPLPLIDP